MPTDGEMDPTIPTSSSTFSSSSSSVAPSTIQASQILEISLISAQDLPQVSKSMRTYAVVWIHPNQKLTTRVDNEGHNNPTWNDRVTFRVDDGLLYSDQSAVKIEIYTVSWFRDVHVGSVRVLLSNLVTPYARNRTRFVALQIRRSSGNPQGKLNMGVALMDCTKRSMPICNNVEISDDEHKMYDNMPLCRSYSLGTSDINEEYRAKAGSMVNGSYCNGSELYSDVGPSASIVAAELALKSRNLPPIADHKSSNKEEPGPGTRSLEELLDDHGNSIVMEITFEEAREKGLTSNIARWKKELSLMKNDDDDDNGESEINDQEFVNKHSRRHSDGGYYSCFGSALGFEFKIVCGAGNNRPKGTKSHRKMIASSSSETTSFTE